MQITNKLPTLELTLGQKRITALIDSGAVMNIIRSEFMPTISKLVKVENTPIKIRGINGKISSPVGMVRNIPVSVMNKTVITNFLIIDDATFPGDALVSYEFLHENKITINFGEGSATIGVVHVPKEHPSTTQDKRLGDENIPLNMDETQSNNESQLNEEYYRKLQNIFDQYHCEIVIGNECQAVMTDTHESKIAFTGHEERSETSSHLKVMSSVDSGHSKCDIRYQMKELSKEEYSCSQGSNLYGDVVTVKQETVSCYGRCIPTKGSHYDLMEDLSDFNIEETVHKHNPCNYETFIDNVSSS